MPRKNKKVVLEPAGKDLREFQAKYADAWHKFVTSPAGVAGLQFLRNRKLDSVANLNEEQIENHSRQHLSELRGFLQLETEMTRLHEMTEFTLPFEEPDEYISPEQEAEMKKLQEKFREETRKQRYA